MDNAIDQIPAEAWPWIDLLFNITCAAAGIWLAITVFVLWRRAASNVTPVSSVPKNKRAQPDFLEVDEKARREAIARGEAFDKELEARDRAEARQERRAAKHKRSPLQRIAGLITLLMAIFSLVSAAVSVIWQVGFIGNMLEQYSAGDRLMALVTHHPIGVTIAVLVICFHIYRFFTDRKWQQEA
ncbi:MAG: hypothetical protein MRY64_04905 [Hyphomonadaceae bacterium]|nr:hypothetical protein [Hyphomonadaceae bacterium]